MFWHFTNLDGALAETSEPIHVDERLALVVLVVKADESIDLSFGVFHN